MDILEQQQLLNVKISDLKVFLNNLAELDVFSF
jgi:hypothetical protein